MIRLSVVHCTRKAAKEYVAAHHRHHNPALGDLFCLAVCEAETGKVRGVATVGRPVARHFQDGWTVEVNRLATDGCQNACSALYGAAWKVAKAMGYRRIVTYTLTSESGASLRAVGWRRADLAARSPEGWANRPDRETLKLDSSRVRWVAEGNPPPFDFPIWPKTEEAKQIPMFEGFDP